MQQHEEFPCKSTKTLNNAVATKYMPHARSAGTLSKTDSWVQKFFVFAQKICRESGQPRSDLQCLASNNMCRHFITHTAEEDKGFSRARSARTVLSMERKRRGLPELTEDMQIAAVVNGVETANPRTKKQSAGLTATMVKFIRKVWGKSRSWWKRQNAAMLTLGFVSIMRLGELVSLKRSRIHIVLKDGSEVELHKLKAWPARSMIVGMLLHLPWRKNHPGVDCWIPVACPITIDLILQQVSTLRSMRSRSDYLFPSRAGKRINKTNHINQQSARGALQHALLECVPLMSRRWAKMYTGHALRVGGSNHMRKIGVANDVHRRMGGWMSLVAAQGYMAMSTSEQFNYTLKLAKSTKRRSGLTKASAGRALLTTLRPHTVG